MSTKKALIAAVLVTVVSAVLLTITRGIPTVEQATTGCIGMFAVAFVVFKFAGSSPVADKG